MPPVEAQAAELEQAVGPVFRQRGRFGNTIQRCVKRQGGIGGEGRSYGLRADLARALVGSTGLGNQGISVADVAPVIGGVLSSQEAWRAFEAGHYGEAALDAVGVIPSAGLGSRVGKKQKGSRGGR